MSSEKLSYKSIPGYGLMTERAHELRLEHFRMLSCHADYLTSSKLALEEVQHNIESFIGAVEHPLGIAGPLLFQNGEEGGEWLHSGICTSEGALVASMNRGAKAISESGGFSAHYIYQKMVRVPLFAFADMPSALHFEHWIRENFHRVKEEAERHSTHAVLLEIKPVLTGKFVHLRFIYSTGDASGQNMVTHCTWKACTWMEEQYREDGNEHMDYFHIEAGGSSDKRVSFSNILEGRGVSVIAECFLLNEVIEKTLRTTAEDMFTFYRNSTAIAQINGTVGNAINAANAIAGIFAATGQDLASVHESSVAIVELERNEEGLYLSLSLPCLVISTIGGGTHLPGPRKVLEFMNCSGQGKLERFARHIAGFALSLDISTCAALASGQFAGAHEKHGKNKPEAKTQQ